jgi:hypothetical protein
MDILRKYIKVILFSIFSILILIAFGIILTLVSLFFFNYNIKEGTNVWIYVNFLDTKL